MSGPVRPQAAAGILAVRRPRQGPPEILLGRRHGRTRFMPGVYVGPGGRLDAGDSRRSGLPERPPTAEGAVDGATRRRLMAFARCALRETAEETGLLFGRPARRSVAAAAEPWRGFAAQGLTPAFGDLRLIARAITPAGSPIRFHTRFFLIDGALATGTLGGDGELEDLCWAPASKLETMPMAEVTALVIAEALRQSERPGPARAFTWRGARRSER